jgi:hypothetical protein
MVDPRYITITVQYDGVPKYGRSLGWIAPELKNSTLTMTDDHIAGPRPSRTWAGMVDGPTFERFARAWRLPGQITSTTPPVTDDPDRAPRTYTLDGMNWEVGGFSPIVWVSVQVTRPPRARSQAEAALGELGDRLQNWAWR